ILGFGLYGSTFIIPLYTQSLLGWTAFQSGMLMIPATLATAFMMPVVGKLISKGVPQPYMVAVGLLLFFVYSLWGYKIITPNTGADNFFWMLIVRGLGLSLLFIPITTMALSTLKGQQIGQGAAFTGMMRQLGGSFGVAAITTFISNRNMLYRNDLISKLDVNDLNVQQRVMAIKQGFVAKGMTTDVALGSAYKTLDLSITKQAAVLSYMDVFLYLGVLFLVCIPFILFIRRRKTREAMNLSEAMH
ncbi:MAG TPA: MFS transporter, partial [Niabella sp.]|nr:MFS transporter [Niabella sp.]